MPEPTIDERVQELREALQLGVVNLIDVPGLFHSDKLREYTERQKRLRKVCAEHIPAILNALTEKDNRIRELKAEVNEVIGYEGYD